MDMVPQKSPESTHNFETDPLQTYIDDEGWVRAKGTTLGADNGLGVAAIMAVCRPAWAVALPVYLVGISMIVYGVVEIVNMFKIRQLRRALKKSNEEFADYTEVTD